MVTRNRTGRRNPRGTALLLTLLAAASIALAAAGTAAADPTPTGSDVGTGQDSTCGDVHDTITGLGDHAEPIPLDEAATGYCRAVTSTTDSGGDPAWDTPFGRMVASLTDGLGQGITMSLAWWAQLPNTRVADTSSLLGTIDDYTYDLQLYLLAASVIVCGVRLARARRDAVLTEATESFRVLARTILASTTWAGVLILATRAADGFAAWIIDDATHHNAKNLAQAMISADRLHALSPGLVFIIAVLGLLGAVAQMIAAVVRQGVLAAAAGFLPLAAASSGTRTGRGSYERLLAWTLAFLLWKPVAATVYMIAFVTADPAKPGASPTQTAQHSLVGIALLCSAVLVLPALLRLVSPLTRIATGTSSASSATSTGAGASRPASGAKDTAGGSVTRVGVAHRPTGAAVALAAKPGSPVGVGRAGTPRHHSGNDMVRGTGGATAGTRSGKAAGTDGGGRARTARFGRGRAVPR